MRIEALTGLIENVPLVASPNFDARPAGEISLVVVHGISLPPGEFGGPWVHDLFCNRLDPALHPYFDRIKDLRVSAHVFIRRDASLVQFVPFTGRAWHAGQSSFEGRERCNDFSIGVEVEGADDVPYEPAQYEALESLIRALIRAYPGITPARVVGHCHISPGRKTDPGPSFDWTALRRRIGAA